MEHLQIRAARRVAEQPMDARLNGEQADTAETLLVSALMEAAGLSHQDACRVLSAYGWDRFNSGVRLTRDAFTATERGLAATREV